MFIQDHGSELGHFKVDHPFHHFILVLGIFGEDLIFEFFMAYGQ
jgi:hypothetical protein